ncbi:MAG: hypothetical protein J0H18_03120 [Rhizobiales bacterium]|nr:hypothetical protein [Hyphomicrobiales bacterium]OJY06649.1 MAG: hypothetical protein BGP07_16525 [Rhizobiales bacterium 63-22]
MANEVSTTVRIQEIENALASALARGDFEVVNIDGERFLQPVLQESGIYIGGQKYPVLSLYSVARDLERLLHG